MTLLVLNFINNQFFKVLFWIAMDMFYLDLEAIRQEQTKITPKQAKLQIQI